ncbi:MAG: ATP-binding protein [Propionibacteriaceae bacterium]|nr:ATP-binding protein [Propionibacteriaceae bacterium]
MNDLVTRHAEPIARDILSYMPGLIIEGARQVGKSTLGQQLISGDANANVMNLDDEQTLAAAKEDPAGFVAQAGSHTLVIDEVQRLPNLTLAVKSAIDRDRQPGRFILTGSSSLLRTRGLSDSLAGRVGRLTLFGFSQGELVKRHDDFASSISEAPPGSLALFTSTLTRPDYVRLVVTGAYPDVQKLSDQRRGRWLDDYLQGLIRRDMPELRRLFNPDRAMSLMRLLAANQAGELVKARLANEAGISAAAIDSYLDLLADTWLIDTLPPWTPNLSERESARHKGFIVDSGLTTRVSRLTIGQLDNIVGGAFGGPLEGFVAAELLRQRTWSRQPFELFHYRDRAGAEIDLILELSGGGIIAVEVKSATTFQTPHFKHLRTLRDKLGSRFVAGIVLNTGQQGYRFADRLYGLPVSALWQL